MIEVVSDLVSIYNPAWINKISDVSNSLQAYKTRHAFKPYGIGHQADFYSLVVLNDVKGEMEWAFSGNVHKSKLKIRKRIKLVEKKLDEHELAAAEEIAYWKAHL